MACTVWDIGLSLYYGVLFNSFGYIVIIDYVI